MAVNHTYALISTVACWFRIAATSTAAVVGAANNVYLPANTYVEIRAEDATQAFVSIIRVDTDGTANLVLME